MSHGLYCPSFSGQKFKTGLMVGAAFVVMATAAQAQEAQQQADNTVVLAPISIDAKADVITGRVRPTRPITILGQPLWTQVC